MKILSRLPVFTRRFSDSRCNARFRSVSTAVFLMGLAVPYCNASPILTVGSAVRGTAAAISTAADLVSLLGLGSSAPSKLMLDFSATQTTVSLSLIGAAINSDFNDIFSGSVTDTVNLAGGGTATATLWTYQLAVNLENGFANDAMSINGFVKHAIGPHPGDDTNGPQLTFNLSVNADSAVPGPGGLSVSASNGAKSLPHPGLTPPHSDTLTGANLNATVVTSVGFVDDITGFTFQTAAEHTPEPATWPILLILLVMSMLLRKRMKMGGDRDRVR